MAQLLPLQDVLQRLLRHVSRLPAEETPLERAVGRVLAADVTADRDIPPWTKAMMDGYAVRSRDLEPDSPWRREDRWRLRVVGELTAGGVAPGPLEPGQALKIMTGAPLPPGADAVAMIEHVRESASEDDSAAKFVELDRPLAPGENVLPQAAVIGQGRTVFPEGWVLRPQDIGLLAEVGAVQVQVGGCPRVGILATGDELVPPQQQPGPGRIRNSNGPMLAALVQSASARPVPLGIARDRDEELRRLIDRGLECHVLLLSGGVSKGTRDLVPAALARCGVERLVHGVALKPGKPLWVGVARDRRPPRLVFGLPGNPMSTLVCFELFVRPVLARLQGHPDPGPHFLQAQLAQEFRHRGDRTTLFPARLERNEAAWQVVPLHWQGSADIQVLSRADALVRFEAGRSRWPVGSRVPVLPLPAASLCRAELPAPSTDPRGLAGICDRGEC